MMCGLLTPHFGRAEVMGIDLRAAAFQQGAPGLPLAQGPTLGRLTVPRILDALRCMGCPKSRQRQATWTR